MKKKMILALIMSLAVMFAFAGCGSTDGAAEEPEATAQELPMEISQADWNDHRQKVELSTGIEMAYVEMGDPEGEPLVLVHGMTDNSRTWSLIAPYFAKAGYHIYMIDDRGHGQTDKPGGFYTMDDYAEDVGAALAEEGLDGVTFRGAKGYNLHLGAIVPMFGGSLTGGLYYADGDAKLSNGLAKVDLKAFGASFKYAYPLSKRTDIYCGVDFAQQKVDNLKVLGTGVSGDEKDTNTAVFAGLTHRF